MAMPLVFTAALMASEACIHPLGAGAAPRLFAPVDGETDVPTNAQIIVQGFGEVSVEADTGAVVDVSVSALLVESGFESSYDLRVLRPVAVLPADVDVFVKADGAVVGAFRTGQAPDTEPPPPPEVSVLGPYSDGACPPYVELRVDSAPQAAFAEAFLDDDEGERVHGLSVGTQLVVAGPADETRAVRVQAVDLAGNRSRATVVEATFPSEFGGGGCAAGGSDGVDASVFGLVALLGQRLRRRRRRHRHRGV